MLVEDHPAPYRALIDRPILIVSAPRSGSTLLFETLARARELFTTGGESHRQIESIPNLFPPNRGWDSNRLTADDADEATGGQLAANFYAALRDRAGRPAAGPVRMLEKTPKNALRVPFFRTVWKHAGFVYLYRDPRQTLASMMRAWQSGRFRTYPRLPGWSGLPWSLLLVPGWRGLDGKPLPEVVARQWEVTTRVLIDDLAALPAAQVTAIDYDRFLAAPAAESARLLNRFGVDWNIDLPERLPPSRMTLTEPHDGKWRELQDEIEGIWPLVAETDGRAREFVAAHAS